MKRKRKYLTSELVVLPVYKIIKKDDNFVYSDFFEYKISSFDLLPDNLAGEIRALDGSIYRYFPSDILQNRYIVTEPHAIISYCSGSFLKKKKLSLAEIFKVEGEINSKDEQNKANSITFLTKPEDLF